MSAYYDLFEKPDVRQTGEQQSLYARFVPKGTIDRKEFIERVHLFTGLSRSLLEGAMAGFMDELRDCLANGWTVELGELGYFTPSLSCTRQATDKKELRAASIALRGLNFRLGREFYKDLKGKMQLERCPQSASAPASSADEALVVGVRPIQEECPTRAIASENPIKTDEGQCISCGRCIALCPVGSRNYHYPFLGKKSLEFASANSERKELELFYAVN